MSFKLPTFNLLCNIWTGYGTGGPFPIVIAPTFAGVPCQLRLIPNSFDFNSGTVHMYLALPALTDIRPPNGQTGVPHLGDCVEVPGGTGRYYAVTAVDDRAKGFLNEYRVAMLAYDPNKVGKWPIPTP